VKSPRTLQRIRSFPHARAFTFDAPAAHDEGGGLPVARPAPLLGRRVEPITPELSRARRNAEPRVAKRVLIVEDDDLTREMLATILQSEGYQSDGVPNGLEALSHLHAAVPDLILLDLWMPVMDGWEFCAARAREPVLAAIPLVIISADPRDLRPLEKQLGAAAHLRKPITVEELLDTVRRS